MTTLTAPFPTREAVRSDPAVQAFMLLRIAFTLAPILFGLDKFANVVEIAAGVLVAVAPRIGSLVVAGWLAGIIVNLLLVGGYGDIALRDFGLLLGALTLSRLATIRVSRT
jgi:hypothetical protein